MMDDSPTGGTSAVGALLSRFGIDGTLIDVVPLGEGHINDTFVSRYRTPSGMARFVHQRLNTHVFTRPRLVMENVVRVLAHLGAARLAPGRVALALIPTVDGIPWLEDADGGWWRTYRYIEGTRALTSTDSAEVAREAASAYGEFIQLLADLPGPSLHETIAGFHDTAQRFDSFIQAVQEDSAGRLGECREEVDAVVSRSGLASHFGPLVAAGTIPIRTVHNDTKLSNVLFNVEHSRAVAVVDLDTVMPGIAPHDFGDLVRSTATRAAEDEPDTSRIALDLSLFTALVSGYLPAANPCRTEVEHLCAGARVVTFEQTIRFLTDYLQGDRYYKTARPDHNLVRARSQLALLRSMERETDLMEETLAAAWRKCAAGR